MNATHALRIVSLCSPAAAACQSSGPSESPVGSGLEPAAPAGPPLGAGSAEIVPARSPSPSCATATTISFRWRT